MLDGENHDFPGRIWIFLNVFYKLLHFSTRIVSYNTIVEVGFYIREVCVMGILMESVQLQGLQPLYSWLMEVYATRQYVRPWIPIMEEQLIRGLEELSREMEEKYPVQGRELRVYALNLFNRSVMDPVVLGEVMEVLRVVKRMEGEM